MFISILLKRWRSLFGISILLASLFSTAGRVSFAGDFIDTRITFAISDDNLFLGPGESNPSSPSVSFIPGRRSTLFFDNYNTRFSGFESLSHAVLYKKMPSFFTGLTTEAALVVRMNYLQDKKTRRWLFILTDSGSYILLTYDFNRSKKLRRNLALTAFPLSSERFRLGYSYRISWGGDTTFPRRTITSPVPGFKLQFNYDFSDQAGMFIFGGMKTAFLEKRITPEQIEEETAYAALGGFGFRVGGFQIEGGGGFFDKGTFSNPGVKGEPVYFYGFSGQISYSYGIPVGVSIDFRLYKNDPDMPMKFFKPEKYEPGKFSFMIASEFSYVVNLLQNTDKLDEIAPQPGIAGDINFRMKYGYLRVHLDAEYRDLGFILKDVPGIVPFQTISSKQKVSPEFFIALGADYHFKKAHLTVGLKGGVMFPAFFRGGLPEGLIGSQPPKSLRGEQIVVVRDEGDFVLLPVQDEYGNKVDVLPVVSFKLNFKWQLSEFLASIGEVLFSVDQNQTRLERAAGEDGTVEIRRFVNPLKLGFNLVLQARF